jgi:hypothetical protein
MVFIQLKEQLKSLSNLLILLNDNQYTKTCRFLGSASIGDHTRHIIELLKCSVDGYYSGTPPVYVTTTYYREIVYNTEHTIHHLALIRVALREMNLDIVGDDFGVAHSTIKYRYAHQ